MKTKYLPLTLFIMFLLAAACSEQEEDLLSGTWIGMTILEDQQPLSIDPSDIRLTLLPDGEYRYQSTLKYKEAGTYYVNQQYLYTTDTLDQAATEKAVEVMLLSPDSLHIRMNEAGKERLLKMVRQ